MRAACCEATVLRNEVIAPDIRLLTVVWPDRDHAPHAGQFFTLRSWGADEAPFLSRPISVHRWNPDSSTIEFLYQVVGEGTEKLAQLKQQASGFRMNESNFHLASTVTRSFVDHANASFGQVSDSCFDVVNAQSHMLDARAVFSNVFADRTIVVFSDINKELNQGFAAGNKYGSNTLFFNFFSTGSFQAQYLSVNFCSFFQGTSASDTYMVNTNSFECHNKFLLKLFFLAVYFKTLPTISSTTEYGSISRDCILTTRLSNSSV